MATEGGGLGEGRAVGPIRGQGQGSEVPGDREAGSTKGQVCQST